MLHIFLYPSFFFFLVFLNIDKISDFRKLQVDGHIKKCFQNFPSFSTSLKSFVQRIKKMRLAETGLNTSSKAL